MCGIVAYNGSKNAIPIVTSGLKRLEYRGYDSSGIAYMLDNDLKVIKQSGKVDLLEKNTPKKLRSNISMGHTRWATHGVPSDENAHPHLSMNNNLAIVHNGIIENHSTIKEGLKKRGYVFKSDTDTEVLINLIDDVKNNENINLFQAVQLALSQIIGAYAIVILDAENPNKLVVAKKGESIINWCW